MSASYNVAKLTKSDKAPFVSLMSRAFARDPLFLHLFENSERDRKAHSRMTAFMSFMFDKSFMLDEEMWGIFENNVLLGAYVVEKPQTRKLRQVQGGLLLLGRLIPLLFRLSGQALVTLNRYMRVTRSSAPPSAHHYLIMIGVDPAAQGKGIGTALLEQLINTVIADANSRGVALDTENKENVNWYRQFGFQLHAETQLNHIPVYCMFYQQ
ncbi:hypothetical protein PAECIP111893_00137 [Paenibacillus plantiphilus]|uniref:N-acetyltransferase domain-containing protein n=1 Tax=Paenibacillus plantiphilus TaxID=2905650 RepID=A0ABN8FWB9_9BACL|nr:GNAT family N-acetyltransferase [Paenibacillus plantiphilus]CAH1190053.1 hypothetical protein PAECIP111893_00137 [Paenibacillus plantiphilus]